MLNRKHLTAIDGMSRSKAEAILSISRDPATLAAMTPQELSDTAGRGVTLAHATQVIELASDVTKAAKIAEAAKDELDRDRVKMAQEAEKKLLDLPPKGFKARTPFTAEPPEDTVLIEIPVDQNNRKRLRGTRQERRFVELYRQMNRPLPPNWRELAKRNTGPTV